MKDTLILTLSCPDRSGLVAKVSTFIFDNGGNITEAQQFDDQETQRFFMRVVFETDAGTPDLSGAFQALASHYQMDWRLRSTAQKPRVILMVSKLDHCFGDLLYRNRIGELDMEVVGIISNHPKKR